MHEIHQQESNERGYTFAQKLLSQAKPEALSTLLRVRGMTHVAVKSASVHALSQAAKENCNPSKISKWTCYLSHRPALASKDLSPVKGILLTAIIIVIKTRPLKTRLFARLSEEMGTEHTF